jgi:hypothetical protein
VDVTNEQWAVTPKQTGQEADRTHGRPLHLCTLLAGLPTDPDANWNPEGKHPWEACPYPALTQQLC